MRFLICLGFWLSVVVYNLPSPESEPTPAGARKPANITRSANTPNGDSQSSSCTRNRLGCHRRAQAAAKHGESPSNRLLSKPDQNSQNTLRLSDLYRPWLGRVNIDSDN